MPFTDVEQQFVFRAGQQMFTFTGIVIYNINLKIEVTLMQYQDHDNTPSKVTDVFMQGLNVVPSRLQESNQFELRMIQWRPDSHKWIEVCSYYHCVAVLQ